MTVTDSQTIAPEDVQNVEGQGEGQGEQAPEGGEQATGKRKRSATTKYAGKDFVAAVMDELPPEEPAGRSRLYFDLLTSFAEDNENLGKWHELARFGTPNGAKQVANTMNKQMAGTLTDKEKEAGAEREIPLYEGWTWEFAGRKVAAEGSDDPTARHSVLWSRLIPVQEQAPEPEAPQA